MVSKEIPSPLADRVADMYVLTWQVGLSIDQLGRMGADCLHAVSRGAITVTALCSLSAVIRSCNKGCVQAQLPTLVDDTVRLETDTRPRITLSALNQRPGQRSVLVLPTVVLTTYPYLFQCAQGH